MRVVRVRVDLLLSRLARGALGVDFLSHVRASLVDPVDPRLHVRQALSVTVESRRDTVDR